MSRLPNAPLVEVIFEIRWDSRSTDQLDKYAYLIGDYYNSIKDNFPVRQQLIQSILPVDSYIGLPAHRFWSAKDTYPLIQLGPGILTVNTLGDNYDWDTFSKDILFCIEKFNHNYKPENNRINVLLQYIDFIPFDFLNEDVVGFLSEKLHTDVQPHFFETESIPENIGYYFSYIYEDGKIGIDVKTGKLQEGQLGLIIRTVMSKDSINLEVNGLMDWSSKAHTKASELFKKMTEGDLYNSFL